MRWDQVLKGWDQVSKGWDQGSEGWDLDALLRSVESEFSGGNRVIDKMYFITVGL